MRPAAGVTVELGSESIGVLVRLRGEIDLNSAPQLREQLGVALDSARGRLILDLAGVPYIDSSGVGTIVELKRRADKADVRLVLSGLQPRVRGVFELTRLDRFLTIVESVEEARSR